MTEPEQPLYQHDCTSCIFLGSDKHGDTTFDLYYCPQGDTLHVIR